MKKNKGFLGYYQNGDYIHRETDEFSIACLVRI